MRRRDPANRQPYPFDRPCESWRKSSHLREEKFKQAGFSRKRGGAAGDYGMEVRPRFKKWPKEACKTLLEEGVTGAI